MINKVFFFFFLFLVSVPFSFAADENNRISLSVFDFEVQSGNSANAYIGKGFSSLISTELRKSPILRLSEREQINKILAEQKLQLSGLTDSAVMIGNLLSIDYMLTGSIVDMNGSFIFEASLIDVETAEVLWTETIVENLNAYEFVSTVLAASLLGYLDVKPDETTVAAAESPKPRDEEIILNLSKGINEIDKGNTQNARDFLTTAEKLDPENETIQYFISKLYRNTSRFKIMAEPNYTYGNPARLGLIEKDKLFYAGSWPPFGPLSGTLNPIENLNYLYSSEMDASGVLMEIRMKLGYSFPMSRGFGGQIEGFFFHTNERLYSGEPSGNEGYLFSTSRTGWGGVFSSGYSFTPQLSIGLGIGAYSGQGEQEDPTASSTNFSLTTGILFFNSSKTFSFDSIFGYNSGSLWGTDRLGDSSSVLIPMYNENSASFTLTEDLLLVLKQRNMFRMEESYYQGTVNPAIEFFKTEQFSLRGGLEGSFTHINETDIPGWGLLLGTSYTLKSSGMGIDINISYRQRPAFTLGELLIPELVINGELYYEGLFFKGKK